MTVLAPPRATSTRLKLGGFLAVVLIMIVPWLATGVQVQEIAADAGYQLVYVLMPGIIIYRALASSPGGRLCHLALGWSVGYAIEMVVFAGAASLHLRSALDVYPLVVVVTAGACWLRTRTPPIFGGRTGVTRAPILLSVGALAVALTYLAASYYVISPLPRSATDVAYDVDNVYALSLTANIVHNWPPTYAPIAGTPLRYYVLGPVHVAAEHQVTGIDISTIVLRLAPAVLIVLAGLAMIVLGEAVSGSMLTGAVAAVLLFIAGTLDMNPTRILTTVPSLLPRSISFLLAVPLFLALLAILVREVLTRSAWPRLRVWVLLALLAFALAGAKLMGAVDMMGGLALCALWLLWRDRSRAAAVIGAFTAVAAATLSAYLLFIAGPTSSLFEFSLSFHYWYYFAPLVGVVWLPRRGEPEGQSAVVLVAAVFLTALLLSSVLTADANSQSWFFYFGWIAALALSAEGLVARYRMVDPAARRALLALPVLFGVVVVIVAGAAFAAHGSRAGRPWYGATYGTLVVIAIAALVALRRRLPESARHGVLPLACVSLLLGLTSGETPVKTGGLIFSELRHHRSLHPTNGPENFGVTPAMWQGLHWIQSHTPTKAIIAVDTHYLGVRRRDAATYFYFSAFTERGVYLEAWGYTPWAEALLAHGITSIPSRFSTRYHVNQEAFATASPVALGSLRRAGVRYVVVDLVHGPPSAALTRALPIVFSNQALVVYRL